MFFWFTDRSKAELLLWFIPNVRVRPLSVGLILFRIAICWEKAVLLAY